MQKIDYYNLVINKSDLTAMITDDLLLVLKNFQGVREEQGENEKLRNLAVQFMNVAENILLGACFEVNGVRRIYPLEIEFYYHEEGDDGLKDPVMYHTNDHENKQLDYYPLGSLNCHVSGIDITFENEENIIGHPCWSGNTKYAIMTEVNGWQRKRKSAKYVLPISTKTCL